MDAEVGLTVIFIVAGASWFASAFYGIKAMRCTRPGVSLFSRETLWNPANGLLLRPDLLTPDGMAYRRRWIVASMLFFASIGTGFVIAVLSGQ